MVALVLSHIKTIGPLYRVNIVGIERMRGRDGVFRSILSPLPKAVGILPGRIIALRKSHRTGCLAHMIPPPSGSAALCARAGEHILTRWPWWTAVN